MKRGEGARQQPTDRPTISLVTPCLEGGRFLEQAIGSVLDQGYAGLEYMVIDGGSDDSSTDIIRRYEDRLAWWVSEKDEGQADALNKGFARSTGEIMGWLNSDDLHFPWTLSLVGEIFATFPHVSWITGLPSLLDPHGRLAHVEAIRGYLRPLLRRGYYHDEALGCVQQESTFWRRSLWEAEGGGLRIDLKYAMDFDLWTRFARHVPLVTVPTVMAGFRRHGHHKTGGEGMTEYEREVRLLLEETSSAPSRTGSWPRRLFASSLGLSRVILRHGLPLSVYPRIAYAGPNSGWVMSRAARAR
jgi:hypothetical protein